MTTISAAVLIAAACTLCWSAEIPTPKYSQQHYHYLEAVKKSSELVSLTNPEDSELPSVKRQYIILLAAVLRLGELMSTTCESETYQKSYFPIINDVIPDAWQNPTNVKLYIGSKINAIEDKIKPLVDLISKYCNHDITRSAEDEVSSCNNVVDLHVQLEPEKYKEPVKILKNLSAAAEIYLDNPHTEVAKRHGVVPYLLDAHEELRPLVMSLAKAIRELQPNGLKCGEEEKI